MIHSFLLIGQSNAAGRGFLKEAAPLDTCGGNAVLSEEKKEDSTLKTAMELL